MEVVKVGKRGTIIVPAKLRKRYGIEEGTLVTTEALRRRCPDPPGSCCACGKIYSRTKGGVSPRHRYN